VEESFSFFLRSYELPRHCLLIGTTPLDSTKSEHVQLFIFRWSQIEAEWKSNRSFNRPYSCKIAEFMVGLRFVHYCQQIYVKPHIFTEEGPIGFKFGRPCAHVNL